MTAWLSRQRLDTLRPRWLREAGFWGAGVRWRCAKHGDHDCELHFSNPADGGSLPGEGRVFRHGTSFSTLTIAKPIDLGDCFRGWLLEGVFVEQTH